MLISALFLRFFHSNGRRLFHLHARQTVFGIRKKKRIINAPPFDRVINNLNGNKDAVAGAVSFCTHRILSDMRVFIYCHSHSLIQNLAACQWMSSGGGFCTALDARQSVAQPAAIFSARGDKSV